MVSQIHNHSTHVPVVPLYVFIDKKKKKKSNKHRTTQKVTITQYKATNYSPHNTPQSQSIKSHKHNTPQFIRNAKGRGPKAEQYNKDKKKHKYDLREGRNFLDLPYLSRFNLCVSVNSNKCRSRIWGAAATTTTPDII